MTKAKQEYYCNLFGNIRKNEPDKLWKNINRVLKPHDHKDTLTEIVHCGQKLSGTSLANTFNDYLVNLDTSTPTIINSEDPCGHIKEHAHSFFFKPH